MENQVQRQGIKYTVLDYKIVPSFLNYLLKLLLLINTLLSVTVPEIVRTFEALTL